MPERHQLPSLATSNTHFIEPYYSWLSKEPWNLLEGWNVLSRAGLEVLNALKVSSRPGHTAACSMPSSVFVQTLRYK